MDDRERERKNHQLLSFEPERAHAQTVIAQCQGFVTI